MNGVEPLVFVSLDWSATSLVWVGPWEAGIVSDKVLDDAKGCLEVFHLEKMVLRRSVNATGFNTTE